MSEVKKRIAFKTLGCRLNQYETDALASQFVKGEYEVVDYSDQADVYVINTCTVTNQSDQKSRNIINQARRRNENSVVVVTGCMVNNKKTELEEKDNITYVVDNERKSSIYPLIQAHFAGETAHPDSFAKNKFNFQLVERGFHTRSMIKIQDGCDNFCTFCIIPKVRGRAISRPVTEIIKNIEEVVALGRKEVVLTGVNIGRYEYKDTNFENLVEQILAIPGDFRVRISSIEPEGFGEKLFELFANPKLCKHLHLCLQSGSEKILLQMHRMYTLDEFRKIIESVRLKYADFNFTTDLITGFPGETEEDFQESIDVANELAFSHIHTFKYSVRKGTRAERMPDHVNGKIKTVRNEKVREVSKANMISYYESMLGKEQILLIERIKDGIAKGYGENYIPIEIEDKGYAKNSFVKVKLVSVENTNEVEEKIFVKAETIAN